ncbi:hypothetical protein J3B02_005007 [Coemansia erecta]|uniref:PB1 domain-containing protein n=1 Tax=Coemansia asiatica TaxID=1052880 RepID=A0A9W7XFI4_9FUNG|nr:hypothetical protein LPJ64_006328 [Coemansia asiatica]KAJ2844292.1 hypothetical protein J3B02_005007 [Coemansia erecta]KAJ2885930.1 hypothetical protein FB639_001676 [Coemansia asiatica]
MAFHGTAASIREEQKTRILELGGRVLKFTNDGGKLFFRYYFPQPSSLTWNKLTSGLRVLYGIASTDLYIRYTDPDGSKITVNDDSGLKIMFDETKASDVIRIEVISDETLPSLTNSNPTIDKPPSIGAAATMTMPMPMPPGFPGMEASRPESALSIPHTNMTGSQRPPPPMQPMHSMGAAPPMPNAQSSGHPGPMPQNIPQSFSTGGPVHNPPQSAYGRLNNPSMSTLAPPNPQEPLN